MGDSAALSALIRETRATAARMTALAESLLEGSGISHSARTTLELIEVTGPQTVPALARRRNTSRQNIQVQIDDLHARGLVDIVPNPGHKRSVLVTLSDAGREQFRAIRAREVEFIARLATEVEGLELRAAAATLRAVGAALNRLAR
jgi:DNA-binding MarR family transcriptional regulator